MSKVHRTICLSEKAAELAKELPNFSSWVEDRIMEYQPKTEEKIEHAGTIIEIENPVEAISQAIVSEEVKKIQRKKIESAITTLNQQYDEAHRLAHEGEDYVKQANYAHECLNIRVRRAELYKELDELR